MFSSQLSINYLSGHTDDAIIGTQIKVAVFNKEMLKKSRSPYSFSSHSGWSG